MTIASCPKCREQVTVPPGVNRDVRVRCPLCQEEYVLAEAIDRLPPMLLIVQAAGTVPERDAVSEVITEDDFAAFAVEDEPLDLEDSLPSNWPPDSPAVSDDAPAQAEAPAFHFDKSSTPAAVKKPAVSVRSRAKKKQGSPIRLIIQTVAGGVVGLMIAQLILWWMPGKWGRSNRDPFGLADKVSPYAPFLLPAELRPSQAAADTVQSDGKLTFGTEDSPATEPPTSPTSSDTAGANDEQEIPDFNFSPDAAMEAAAADKGSVKSATATENSKGKKKNRTPANALRTSEPENLASPTALPTTTEEPEPADPISSIPIPDISFDLSTPAAEPKTMPKDSGSASGQSGTWASSAIKQAPTIQPKDITMRLADVVSTEIAWDGGADATIDEKRRLFADFYGTLARLGEGLVFADPKDPAAGEGLTNADLKIESISLQPDKLALIGGYTSIWLDKEREHNGVVLYGTVIGNEPQGNYVATRIKLAARSGRELTVIRPADAGAPPEANSQVLVLGLIVLQPTQNLQGYEGSEEMVVVSGRQLPVQSQQ